MEQSTHSFNFSSALMTSPAPAIPATASTPLPPAQHPVPDWSSYSLVKHDDDLFHLYYAPPATVSSSEGGGAPAPVMDSTTGKLYVLGSEPADTSRFLGVSPSRISGPGWKVVRGQDSDVWRTVFERPQGGADLSKRFRAA